MRYQILVYQKSREAIAAFEMSLQEWQAACEANAEALAERGYLVAQIELGSQCEGLRIELRNNELVLESNELSAEQEGLIRVIQIEAHDLNHALQIATAMPELNFARLELHCSISNSYTKLG